MGSSIKESVKDYYGKILQKTEDLKTNACCSTDSVPESHKQILKNIEPEILDKYYGCGSPVPPLLDGLSVLDLGSGSGRDAYLISKLVGEAGSVIGIDMTDEQLEVANKYREQQAQNFGFSKPNTTFKKGYIEDLKSADIKDNSIDLVISNCVINLSPDKEAVYKEIFRVLKPGGEMYISDVFADRRIPEALQKDPVLYGECLTGALYTEDFRRILRNCEIFDFRIVSNRKLTIEDPETEKKVGDIGFYSMTIRAFKIALEDICENYGQSVTYNGKIPENITHFSLDDHHLFETGKALKVCGNTADMIGQTRYRKHFRISGDKSTHMGPFDCASEITNTSATRSCC